HEGSAMYTVGQRRGLRIAGKIPLYVISLDRGRNAVVVGPEPELLRKKCVCKNATWMGIEAPKEPLRAGVKIRYHHPKAMASIRMNGGQVEVEFDEPQSAVTPGQAAVFYEGGGPRVLGGGWIVQ
ncbi:MAG: tRNA 2-thiouridine(34) synthase MnmA, partial [Candidatus Omnitrophica bacterium]|nr:tRNA 2-thiouridine(34) synthase MnmA [Candidatus Omnitrophota bacterium]